MRSLFQCVMASVLTMAANGVSAQSKLPQCPGPVPTASWTNCVGERTFPDGAKYVGEYRDGKRHGQGTFTLPSGVRFTGEFKDNKIDGKGTLTFPDGRKFVGEIKDGKPNGQGIEYRANGTVLQSGTWENGKFVRSR